MKKHQMKSEADGVTWPCLSGRTRILKKAVMAVTFLLSVSCVAVASEIILQQDFETFAIDASGDQGEPDNVGGQFGPLKPHAGSPPQSNRLADAGDTVMRDGKIALAIVCGEADNPKGVRVPCRFTRSVPLRGGGRRV